MTTADELPPSSPPETPELDIKHIDPRDRCIIQLSGVVKVPENGQYLAIVNGAACPPTYAKSNEAARLVVIMIAQKLGVNLSTLSNLSVDSSSSKG